jgi:hypothetical protein
MRGRKPPHKLLMATKNNITGDTIASKALSKQGRENWDKIFGKKDPKIEFQSTNKTINEAEESGENLNHHSGVPNIEFKNS